MWVLPRIIRDSPKGLVPFGLTFKPSSTIQKGGSLVWDMPIAKRPVQDDHPQLFVPPGDTLHVAQRLLPPIVLYDNHFKHVSPRRTFLGVH